MSTAPESFAGDVTRLLDALRPDGCSDSDPRDFDDQTFAQVYAALKQVARRQRARWRGNETLNTTALVHEAYLKLIDCGAGYESRRHFLAVASRAMRQLLINYAESRSAGKRGGGKEHIAFDDALLLSDQRSEELLALDGALERLQDMDLRAARVVECRVFGGLSAEETASALGVTRRTVSRDWSAARAWLYGALQADLARSAA